MPHLPDLFPSTIAQRHAFGPGAYLVQGTSEAQALEMEKRDAEVWGFTAALAVNAPEEEQASLVGALREKILHTVSGARKPQTTEERGALMRRNVNMFLNGLVRFPSRLLYCPRASLDGGVDGERLSGVGIPRTALMSSRAWMPP